MATVSAFASAKQPSDPFHLDHLDVVELIRSGKWADKVAHLRSITSPKQAKEFKSTQLPGVVWQGEFSYRNNSSCSAHSGLVCLDFDCDDADQADTLKSVLRDDPLVHVAFTSPSGNGVKVVVRVTPSVEHHAALVTALARHFMVPSYDHFADVSRLCFVSHDPDVYLNESSEVWTDMDEVGAPAPSPTRVDASGSDHRHTFEVLASHQDSSTPYADGTKHKFIVSLLSSLNAYGVPVEDATNWAFERYGDHPGCEAVPLKDFASRARSVYSIYAGQHSTKSMDPPAEPDLFIPPTDTTSPTPQPDRTWSFHDTDPISRYNRHGQGNATDALVDFGWSPSGSSFIVDGVTVASWQGGDLRVVADASPFKANHSYTPFQVVMLARFDGSLRSTVQWLSNGNDNEAFPYIRVGVDYYKAIKVKDRFGIDRPQLKAWRKDEIKQDEGAKSLDKVSKFDNFAIVPDNFDHQPVIGNCYNLYHPFPHVPKEGSWEWTEVLMRHVFGDQYDLGMRYLQVMYLHPTRMLPILVLVSKERQTGKSTFINWINMLFGDNATIISPEDLANSFNYSYATSNVICVEETLIEKVHTVEKLKAMSTGKFISVNQKFVSQYKVPFYGKFILSSNNEDKFARVDQEEIRFFIRKLSTPTTYNHGIEDNLLKEIPAFLHHLTTLPPVDFTRDRTAFTPSELSNKALDSVKKESRSGLYKELKILIEDFFLNESYGVEEFYADPISIKQKWFASDKDIPRAYLINVLRSEFKMEPMPVRRFHPFINQPEKPGAPYLFERKNFVTDELPDDQRDEVPF